MTKNFVFFSLACLALSLCACSPEELQEESVYLSLSAMFPYMTKAFESDRIDIHSDDNCDERYLVQGWSFSEDETEDEVYRWAIGRESSVLLYCTKLSRKVVTMSCKPFNPSGQPYQAGDIFVNDIYLRTINFSRDAIYRFSIPAGGLQYGSNFITFKWRYHRSPADFGLSKDRRDLAVCFLSLRIRDKKSALHGERTGKVASGAVENNGSTISVSPGGIVEYYFPLPGKSLLKFKLSSKGETVGRGKVYIAIHSKGGKRVVRKFSPPLSDTQDEHRIDLREFADETVKIVFFNPCDSGPGSVISWVNPVIATASAVAPDSFGERRNVTRTSGIARTETTPPRRPHVFIYLVDTLRADHVSCYGYERRTTPCIDEFAKDGVLFQNCIANASWTKPAVGSLLTGRYPNKHGGEDRKDRLSGDVMMLPELLQDHGYHTAYITTNGNVTRDYNFDQGNTFYSDDFPSFFRNKYGELTTEEEIGRVLYHSSEFINAAFAGFIGGYPSLSRQPVFAYLHTVDPHDPYTPKEPFLKFKREGQIEDYHVSGEKIRLRNYEDGMSAEDTALVMSLYDCEISHNDYYFGEFLKYLKQHNLYDDSFIVLIADHGEQFNEHGEFLHGYSIYNEEIHVPLIIKFPKQEFAGAQPEFYVSQVDILPTILDYVGMKIPPEVDGTSILDLLQNTDLRRTIFLKEYVDGFNYVGFVSGPDNIKHIIRYGDTSYTDIQSYEQFDLSKDVHEMNNLFGDKSYFELKSIQFKTDWFLEAMKRQAPKREAEVDYQDLSPNTLEALRALGYVK